MDAESYRKLGKACLEKLPRNLTATMRKHYRNHADDLP
jgi:DNA-binding FadR family transcriptional regulator